MISRVLAMAYNRMCQELMRLSDKGQTGTVDVMICSGWWTFRGDSSCSVGNVGAIPEFSWDESC